MLSLLSLILFGSLRTLTLVNYSPLKLAPTLADLIPASAYPWGSALNAIPVDESSFIYRGVLGERNEVRAVHPDFGAIVYLHFGSLVVDDDDSIVYIGNGVQTAWLHFAVRHAASSSLAHELPDGN